MSEFNVYLGAIVTGALLLGWIAVTLGRMARELRKATAYLQQLCWRADEDHGELPQEWRDPGVKLRARGR